MLQNNNEYIYTTLPIEPVNVRDKLEKIAEEYGLLINEYALNKLKWSEQHGGRCMCDWQNRTCPCTKILNDLRQYNGCCLCKLLVTPKAMELIKVNKEKAKTKKVTKPVKCTGKSKKQLAGKKVLAKINGKKIKK